MASRTEGSLRGDGTSTAFAEAHTTTRCLASVRTHPAAGLVELVSQSWSDRFEYFSLGASIYGGEGPRG